MKFKGNNITTPFKEILRDLPGQSEETKTFKERLTDKADKQTYDISKHVEAIKAKMEAHVNHREFVIDLFDLKDCACITLGSGRGPIYQTVIPHGCKPDVYMKLFITALKELGFQDTDITRSVGECRDFYSYRINVKW